MKVTAELIREFREAWLEFGQGDHLLLPQGLSFCAPISQCLDQASEKTARGTKSSETEMDDKAGYLISTARHTDKAFKVQVVIQVCNSTLFSILRCKTF